LAGTAHRFGFDDQKAARQAIEHTLSRVADEYFP
jgi:hypothetical protein